MPGLALATVLSLPDSGALAAPVLPSTGPLQVAAIVEAADGRLTVARSTTTSAAQAQALAARWRDRPRVRAAAVVQPVRALGAPHALSTRDASDVPGASSTPDPLRARQWGLDRLQADTVWAGGTAAGELVAVLDTGVDAAHPDLRGVVVAGRDLVGRSGTGRTDPHGHGTHIAGIVAAVAGNGVGGAGLAQGARILPVRVLDERGRGSDAAVAEGLLWAVDHGATVVNLSLGGPSPSALLATAVRYALQRGVVVVVAAGNDGATGDPVLYPAATPGVLAVGAVDRTGRRPAWSSTGRHLGVVAPGVDVLSTVPGGYASWSGTSMAAPFAAGAVALLQADDPALSPAGVVQRLVATADDLGPRGRDIQHGAGLLDVLSARPTSGRPGAQAAPAPSLVVTAARRPAVVVAGAPVELRARVLVDGGPGAGQPVALEQRDPRGRWAVVRRAATATDGQVSWRLRPERSADYRVAVGAVTSAPVRVDVRQDVRTTVTRSSALRVAVSAQVLPAGRATVELQTSSGAGWRTAAVTATDAAGQARFSTTLGAGTRVRVQVRARTDLLTAASPSVRT